jgi:phosphoadenosine phosphosulfate reductase
VIGFLAFAGAMAMMEINNSKEAGGSKSAEAADTSAPALYRPRACRKRKDSSTQSLLPHQPKHIRPLPFDLMQRFVDQHHPNGIIVGCSGGKDSVATMDVCRRFLPNTKIVAYFMYIVKGLSFQEDYLSYLQRRYNIETIIRVPFAPYLAKWFRHGLFRHPTAESRAVKNVKFRDIDAYVRKVSGLHWIANGERACESVQRNAMLRQCDGVSEKRGRVFPLTYWNDAMVWQYLRQRKVALAPEYGKMGLGRSFASLHGGSQLAAVKRWYPEDFEKIVRVFPLCRVVVERWDARVKNARQQQ